METRELAPHVITRKKDSRFRIMHKNRSKRLVSGRLGKCHLK